MKPRGVALVEALVALNLLASSALAMTALAVQATEAMERSVRMGKALADADRLLTALSLLDWNDLNTSPGRRRIGRYEVRVGRISPSLFRIAVLSDQLPALETVVFRRQPQ